MAKSKSRKLSRIALQAAELALAVPQVVAHRVTRMASAGHNPNARDVREFQRMGAEKTAAFNESWLAMGRQMLIANQQFSLTLMRSWWSPWFGGAPRASPYSNQLQDAALDVIAKGMVPVRKRAVANAKRLARIKRL